MSRLRLVLRLALVFACTFGVQGVAYAGVPWRVFSGATCRNYSVLDAGAFEYTTTGVRNTTSSSKWVICPLVVDINSNDLAPVDVVVYGQTSSLVNVYCQVQFSDLYGNAHSWYNWQGNFNGQFQMSIGRIPVLDYAVGRNVNVLCYLPGNRSALIGSIVLEHAEW